MAVGALGSHGPAQGGQARPDDLVVSAVGMVTPVGADAAQTHASVRAGLRRMRELPATYLCLPEDPRLDEPEPLVGSAVYHLDAAAREAGDAVEWLGLLAGHAFRDLAARGRLEPADTARLGLFLALPRGLGQGAEAQVAIPFHNHAGQDLLPHFQAAAGDRTTGLRLLSLAAEQLRERRISLAAVGGVDSYLFRQRLDPLDRDWRLLSARNPDGFQPGEGAGFLLLESRRDAQARGLRPLAALRGFGAARFDPGKGLPNTGAELAALLEPLLPGAGTSPLVVCDLNGESARGREWAFAVSRLGKRLGEATALEHPASTLGDVGAATGALLPALACQYLGGKHAGRSGALVWAAADDGERCAALLGAA